MSDQTFYLDPTGAAAGNERDFTFVFEGETKLQRGLRCSCFAGAFFSITARQTELDAKDFRGAPLTRPRADMYGFGNLNEWPGDAKDDQSREKSSQNAKVIDAVCQFMSSIPTSGLVVIAGETGSRKSSYARELARRVIQQKIATASKDPRPERPHVVTLEDPIETWFATNPFEASAVGFEYTPRQLGVDAQSLKEVVNDALRQKPALFYVGEVRSKADWREILSFAATGHLAITTTHASSITKTFEKILSATQSDTPADRSDISRTVAAVMHIQKIDRELVPALWMQTARSRTAFTQDGLASLLPTGREDGRYGRRHFADVLYPGEAAMGERAVIHDIRGE